MPENKTDCFLGTGRRKTAVARVRLRDGSGEFTVNGKPWDSYFLLDQDRAFVRAPLEAAELWGRLDCAVKVNGGGMTGQAGAVMLGVSRALKQMRPDLEVMLRDRGFLTRDSRMKERKKYGQKGARKAFQFSKR